MTSVTGHRYGPTLKISTKSISYCADMLTNRTIDPTKATPQQRNGKGDTTTMQWRRRYCDSAMVKATPQQRNGKDNTAAM